MPEVVQRILAAVAWEDRMLATVSEVFDTYEGVLDLREGLQSIRISLRQDKFLAREFRPLAFGAAWKILDTIIECGLRRRQLPFKYKADNAGKAEVPPLSCDPDIWPRLTACYRKTVEVRHCLVHRRFCVNREGNMVDLTKNDGEAIRGMSRSEQDHFRFFARNAISVIRTGRIELRDRHAVIASLNGLKSIHGIGEIAEDAGIVLRRPEVVRVNAKRRSGTWIVDVLTAQKTAQKRFPERAYFDIEVFFPRSGLGSLRGRLEEAPSSSTLPIDPANPPNWIEG